MTRRKAKPVQQQQQQKQALQQQVQQKPVQQKQVQQKPVQQKQVLQQQQKQALQQQLQQKQQQLQVQLQRQAEEEEDEDEEVLDPNGYADFFSTRRFFKKNVVINDAFYENKTTCEDVMQRLYVMRILILYDTARHMTFFINRLRHTKNLDHSVQMMQKMQLSQIDTNCIEAVKEFLKKKGKTIEDADQRGTPLFMLHWQYITKKPDITGFYTKKCTAYMNRIKAYGVTEILGLLHPQTPVQWNSSTSENPWYALFKQLNELCLVRTLGAYITLHNDTAKTLKKELVTLIQANKGKYKSKEDVANLIKAENQCTELATYVKPHINKSGPIPFHVFLVCVYVLLLTQCCVQNQLSAIFTLDSAIKKVENALGRDARAFKNTYLITLYASNVVSTLNACREQANRPTSNGSMWVYEAVLVMLCTGLRRAELLSNAILTPYPPDPTKCVVGYRDKVSSGTRFKEDTLMPRIVIYLNPVQITQYIVRVRVHALLFLYRDTVQSKHFCQLQFYETGQVINAIKKLLQQVKNNRQALLTYQIETLTAFVMDQAGKNINVANVSPDRVCVYAGQGNYRVCSAAERLWYREIWRVLFARGNEKAWTEPCHGVLSDKADVNTSLNKTLQTCMHTFVRHQMKLPLYRGVPPLCQDVKVTSHDCRKIYVNTAYAWYGQPNNITQAIFIQQNLGHDEKDGISGQSYSVYRVIADVDKYGRPGWMNACDVVARDVATLAHQVHLHESMARSTARMRSNARPLKGCVNANEFL